MARTPTSATGAERGFTLVELLVTLVILGLASAAVLLAIPDPQGSLREEGERLAARLAATRDAAIVGGRDMAVRFDAAGYGFETRRGGAWLPADGRAFAARRWPEGTTVTTEPATTRITFDATGLATPTVVLLSRDGAAARVTVEAAGAVRIDAG
jgi:general secretion pathway protein H